MSYWSWVSGRFVESASAKPAATCFSNEIDNLSSVDTGLISTPEVTSVLLHNIGVSQGFQMEIDRSFLGRYLSITSLPKLICLDPKTCVADVTNRLDEVMIMRPGILIALYSTHLSR